MYLRMLMQMMENSTLGTKLTEYIRLRLEIWKAEIIEEVADTIARLTALVVLFSILLIFTLFLNLFFAAYINFILSSSYWGYGIVAGFYLVMLLFLLILHKKGVLKAELEKEIISRAKKNKN